MEVSRATPHRATHQGHEVLFCSARCRARFDAEPARFATPAAPRPTPPPADEGGEYTCPMHPEIVQRAPGTMPTVWHGARASDDRRVAVLPARRPLAGAAAAQHVHLIGLGVSVGLATFVVWSLVGPEPRSAHALVNAVAAIVRGMKLVLGALLTTLAPTAAWADDDGTNVMIGPVLGLRLREPAGGRAILGVEGGGGWGPERINLGVTRRLGRTFSYLELSPWLYVGASLGVGVDSAGEIHGVIGLWEGLPLVYPECGDHGWQPVVTLSVGYRYTGVHELYAAPKLGWINDGAICVH
jgi:YHS domain-containing protein